MCLQVSEKSLENVTHDEAVQALKATGETVRLLLAKTPVNVATAHDSSFSSTGK